MRFYVVDGSQSVQGPKVPSSAGRSSGFSSRGATEKHGGPHFSNAILDVCSNRGPNMKWGTRHHCPPLLALQQWCTEFNFGRPLALASADCKPCDVLYLLNRRGLQQHCNCGGKLQQANHEELCVEHGFRMADFALLCWLPPTIKSVLKNKPFSH